MNKKCQIFTPDGYVKKLLDCIQYCENIYDKNILENSCGDGNILAVIAERYIDDAKAHGLSNQQIKKGLSKHICGVEIDPEQYKKCLQKLNSLAKKRGINGVKSITNNEMIYYDMANEDKIYINTENLTNKWFFTKNNIPGTRRFGDYFQVAHVVATLLNEAYVLKEENCQDINEFYCCNGKKIEKKVVRETATPRSLRYKKREKIIFPYDYKNGKLIRYSTQQFNTQFPGAVNYLNDFREQLDERESDRNALWFEYGRSQALAGLNKRKLLISTVITEKVVVYMLKKKCIPYVG